MDKRSSAGAKPVKKQDAPTPVHKEREYDPRAAVRTGRLEEVMERFNVEMSNKMAIAFFQFCQEYIIPMQAEIDRLKAPWYAKGVPLKIRAYAAFLVFAVREKMGLLPPVATIGEPEAAEPKPAEQPVAAGL